jgi:hypothetical protein
MVPAAYIKRTKTVDAPTCAQTELKGEEKVLEEVNATLLLPLTSG